MTEDTDTTIDDLEEELEEQKQINEGLADKLVELSGLLPETDRRKFLKTGAGAAALVAAGAVGQASAAPGDDGDTVWGTDSNRDDYYVDELDANLVNTGKVSKKNIVSPSISGAYNSIQAAHDALPTDGGVIRVAEDIAETGTLITKQTKIVGAGGDFNGQNSGVKIDTSGGNGIHVNTVACTLRDLQIIGDDTSGVGSYGLKLGSTGTSVRGLVVDNVTVSDKGDIGVLIKGVQQGGDYFLTAYRSGGDNIVIDIDDAGDFFNSNQARLESTSAAGRGLYVTGVSGAEIAGNEFNIHSEGNTGEPMVIDSSVSFVKNWIGGYGLVSAGDPDTYLNGARNNWQTGVGPTNTLIRAEGDGTTVSIDNYSAIPFPTESKDPNSEWDGANYQFTPFESAEYTITAQFDVNSVADSDSIAVRVQNITSTNTVVQCVIVPAEDETMEKKFTETLVGGNTYEFQVQNLDSTGTSVGGSSAQNRLRIDKIPILR